MAQAHEEVAYATYVEKYSSGKSSFELASKVSLLGLVIISFAGMFEGAEKQARASLAIVKPLLPKRCAFTFSLCLF